MSCSEFSQAGFLNRHIRFRKQGKNYQGILFQDNFGRFKTSYSQFTFVPTENLLRWRAAKDASALGTQLSLSYIIDVEDISAVELIGRTLAVI